MEDDLEKEMQADQLRFWQSRPASERFKVAVELSDEAYYRKYPDAEPPCGWDKAKVEVFFFPLPEDDDTP